MRHSGSALFDCQVKSTTKMEPETKHHFLVVSLPVQSHINPTLHLAERLASAGATTTFSTAIYAHRRMFSLSDPEQRVQDGRITYAPFSDGHDDDGYESVVGDPKKYFADVETNGRRNVSIILTALAAHGRPVTCIIYSLQMTWLADVALEHGVPAVFYWIQSATAFAAYYHYFHGYQNDILSHAKEPLYSVSLPGLPQLRIRDLPSFITCVAADGPLSFARECYRELFEALDREAGATKPRVLINTFHALEPSAFASVDQIDMVAMGPMVSCLFRDGEDSCGRAGDLFKIDEKNYMEWLDAKQEGSVVYVSFGSVFLMKQEQAEELIRGLKESKRPYLWVLRRDSRDRGIALDEEESEEGMVVEWCSQVRVLSHPAIGCFVTHCGWNSTLESLACGVPMISVPQRADQLTNSKVVKDFAGAGVRAEANDEHVVESTELKRCLELVLGGHERGLEIRRRAKEWRQMAMEAVKKGGSSYLNLKAFIHNINF